MLKKIVKLSLLIGLILPTIAGCSYKTLESDIEGEITIMLWSGDGSYMEDIGRREIPAEELKGQNQAAAYATAQAFNKLYPNVKINVFAKAGGPDDENGSWAQHRENFKAEYGHYPDIFATTDLPGDISKGLVADLSRFENDPLYKSFNESVMNMMNFDGFQGGLPQYLLPWGIYVNKSLAEDNNLDIPETDWTIEDYTDFIEQADMENFYGAMDTPMNILNTGTKHINQSLLNKTADSDYVTLDSDEVKSLVEFLPEWAEVAVWPQQGLGNIPQEVMDENWWWGFKFFIENKLLTLEGDPWMMGDAAHPNPDHWGRVKADDWDIYPRPATDFQPNTVGVVLDPISVYNYCMDDRDPECTEEEENKIKLAYTFAAFWVGDTSAIEARANQMFADGDTMKTALNDSLPLVTGEEFDKQMDIWYTTETHQRFKDAGKMPGFHKVLEIWEKGQFWDISDKAYPFFHDNEGERRANLHEWINIWNADIVGASRTDSNYVDVVKSRLSDWNTAVNERFEKSVNEVREGLKQYYGYTDKDFE